MRFIVLALALIAAAATARAADSAPPPLEAYGRSPAVSMIHLSPSGRMAAFLVSTPNGRRIAVQMVGGKLLATIDPGAQKLRGIDWAGDDFLLIQTSATVNLGMDWGFAHELGTMQVFNVKTLKELVVFAKDANIAKFVFGDYGVAKVGGRWQGFFGGITLEGQGDETYANHGYPDLYQVDLETGQTHLAARGGETSHSWLVGEDGQVIAHSEYDRKTGLWRLLEGPGSGGREIMRRNTDLEDIELVSQGRTPGTVVIDDDTGAQSVVDEVRLADGKTEPLFTQNGVREFIVDRTSGLLLGAEVLEPEGAVFFDPSIQAKVRGAFKAFPGRRAALAAYDPTFDQMVVVTDGADDPGTYWYVDIPNRSAVPLGGRRPEVPKEEVGATRMVSYKAADGLGLEGVLTLPPGRPAKGLPLVVMPHGGPLGIRDDLGFDWWAQAFAARGYAVLQPNYRGSGGYGLSFERAGYGEWGRKMLTDMSDGVAALAAQGVVDPKRVCIVGGSYGGYAALAGVTLQHGVYRCAVSYAGVADLPALRWWELDRSGEDNEMIRYWRTAVKGEEKGAPALSAISPARHADRADAPVLLIHGKDDTVVPIDQSRKMEGALKAAGKPVEFVELPGQDHWLSDEATRIQMLKASVGFVEKNDPPG